MIRTALFIVATWGIILGASVGAFLGVRHAWPNVHVGIAIGTAAVVLFVGVSLGEWIARLAGMLLFPGAGTDQSRNK